MIKPEDTTALMDYLDRLLDTENQIDNPDENILVIGCLTAMAFARIHFLPDYHKHVAIEGIENQIATAKGLIKVFKLNRES